jgi:hypothetical protein
MFRNYIIEFKCSSKKKRRLSSTLSRLALE